MSAPTVRPATLEDIPELVRHRALMFSALGRSTTSTAYLEATAQAYEQRMGDGTLGVFVIDGDGCLAASGVGNIDRRLPGPETLNGLWGHISGMVTDPAYRRQGLASAVLQELLDWFSAHGITRVELHGSDEGVPLYRRFGFTQRANATALTWTSKS